MDIKLYILIKINGETKLRATARYKVWADLEGIVGVCVLESIDTVNKSQSETITEKKFVTLLAMFWITLARVSFSTTNV